MPTSSHTCTYATNIPRQAVLPHLAQAQLETQMHMPWGEGRGKEGGGGGGGAVYLVGGLFLCSLRVWSYPEPLRVSLHVQPEEAEREQRSAGQADEQRQPSMACNPAPLYLLSANDHGTACLAHHVPH